MSVNEGITGLDIEQRLDNLASRVLHSLKDRLAGETFIPQPTHGKAGKLDRDGPTFLPMRERYTKRDLAEDIVGRFTADGIDFSEYRSSDGFKKILYNSMNKEPLTRAMYGMINVNPSVNEVMQELTPWSAVYFYIGAWARKSRRAAGIGHSSIADESSIYKIVRQLIIEGIEHAKNVHNRPFVKGHGVGAYTRKLETAPHEAEVMAFLDNTKRNKDPDYAARMADARHHYLHRPSRRDPKPDGSPGILAQRK